MVSRLQVLLATQRLADRPLAAAGHARTRRSLLWVPTALAALWLAACAGERVVHREVSLGREIVVAERSDGVRTLRFGERGATQSQVRPGQPRELLVPYVRTAVAALGVVPAPRRLLVVGLGGGAMPMYLREVLPAATIDVAELDPAVARVARDWFGFREDDALRLTVGDGRQFIENVEVAYDAIFLDAYGETDVPFALTTQQFLRATRDALAPRGAVIANLWSTSERYSEMIATYQAVFDSVQVLRVSRRSNRIIVARLGERPHDAPSHDPMAALRDFAADLGLDDALEGGLETPETSAGAGILRDEQSTPTHDPTHDQTHEARSPTSG